MVTISMSFRYSYSISLCYYRVNTPMLFCSPGRWWLGDFGVFPVELNDAVIPI